MGGGDAADDGVESSNDVEEVTVNISCWNGSNLAVQVNLNSTVGFFKSVLAPKCEIPAQQQRLIYRGSILKDDQTLQSYGVGADHTVHLVRSFVTAAPTGNATTTDAGVRNTNSISTTDAGSNVSGLNGLGSGSGIFGGSFPELEQMQQMLTQNPDMIRDILNMPAVHNLMNNPETIHNLIMSNPQMREIMDRNPDLTHILNDPATPRQTMEAARNPEIMREMMRHTDRAMSNIGSSPEGFNMLSRMYGNVQESFLNETTMTGNNSSDLLSNPFVTILGAPGGRPGRENSTNSATPAPEITTNSTAPNANPLPNPWASAGAGRMQTNLGWQQFNPTGNVRSASRGVQRGRGIIELEALRRSMPDVTFPNLISSPQFMNQLQNILGSNPQLRDMMQNRELIRQTSRESVQNNGETGSGAAADNTGLNLMNLFAGVGTGDGVAAPNRPQRYLPPEELYAAQLSQLQEMGFFDTQENLRALTATAGNVPAAVQRLLGNAGQ